MKTRLTFVLLFITMPIWVIPCASYWVLSGESTLFGYISHTADKFIK